MEIADCPTPRSIWIFWELRQPEIPFPLECPLRRPSPAGSRLQRTPHASCPSELHNSAHFPTAAAHP